MTDDELIDRAMAGEFTPASGPALAAEVRRLLAELRVADGGVAAGKSLARWAAAVHWSEREANTAEWLEGLRVRINRVQGNPDGHGPDVERAEGGGE